MKEGRLYDFLTEPRKIGKGLAILLLGSVFVSSALAVIETRLDNNKLNKIYQQSGGTNTIASKLDKINFIRTQPNYSSTNENARFLGDMHASSLPNVELSFRDLKYIFSQN